MSESQRPEYDRPTTLNLKENAEAIYNLFFYQEIVIFFTATETTADKTNLNRLINCTRI